MLSLIIVFFGHFMTVYRLCKVLRKGYTTICEVYSTGMRELLKAAVNDPKKDWDDQLMGYMDKIFKYQVQKTIPKA